MAETEVKKRLTNKQAVDPIRRLFEDLNQPSEPRLKQALKARGIPFTNEQVSRIVKGSASRQICAPRQRFVGKVTSTEPNLRWAADMVFMTSTPSKNGQKFILVVQDIFSRKYIQWHSQNIHRRGSARLSALSSTRQMLIQQSLIPIWTHLLPQGPFRYSWMRRE